MTVQEKCLKREVYVMASKVITINRQYGSNGRQIGRKLAEQMGVHFYDKDLLEMIQLNTNIPYEELVKVDERAASKWRFPVDDAFQMQAKYRYEPMNDVVYKAQSAQIKTIAERESCVIVGRCSNYLLKDRPNHISVFIFAPIQKRIENVRERSDISETEAAILIKKIDKERRYYYNYHTDEKWEEMYQYDLCIDSSKFTADEIVNMILALDK